MYSLAEHDGFATVNGRGIGTPGVVMVGAEPVSAESSPHWAQLLEAGAVCNNSTIDDGVVSVFEIVRAEFVNSLCSVCANNCTADAGCWQRL